MRTPIRAGVVGLGAIIAMACGGSSSSSPAPAPPPTPAAPAAGGFVITIQNLSFSPLNLHAPPGATVTVVNNDGATSHSVTSEARANAFTPAAVGGVSFDTGIFTGTKTFTLPANAPNGTAIPYYCRNHMADMVTPTGTLTIDSSAQGGAAPTTPTTPMAPGPGSPGY
jgi:plastocyanin